MSTQRVALVLSGGGMKAAAFHIGVCLALKLKGYKFVGGPRDQLSSETGPRLNSQKSSKEISIYVGSSAGAFITALLANGYSVESLIQAFRVGIDGVSTQEDQKLEPLKYRDIFGVNHPKWENVFSWSSVLPRQMKGGFEFFLKKRFRVNGLFNAQGMETYLREKTLVLNDFSALGPELFIIGTQLNHSRKVIFGRFPDEKKNDRFMFINHAHISEAVAASVSLPPVFAPFEIEDPSRRKFYFYDGEIRDTLSTHVAADFGADLVISSYSIMPYHFKEEIGSLHKFGIPVIINQALYQVIQQKIDKHILDIKNYGELLRDIEVFSNEKGIPPDLRDNLLSRVAQKLNFRPGVQYKFIAPKPQNHEMFFADHFSMNSQVLEKIIRIGFKSALLQLRDS